MICGGVTHVNHKISAMGVNVVQIGIDSIPRASNVAYKHQRICAGWVEMMEVGIRMTYAQVTWNVLF